MIMAKESTQSSVATSPSTPSNWWELHHHPSSISSWTNSSSPWNQHNPNSNSSCEEEVSMSISFTYASNQSGLTVESAHRTVEPATSSSELMGEHTTDNHQLWSQVLLSDGSDGDLHNSTHDVGENLLDPLSSKIFDPAPFDYLKKMDSNWEFTNSSSFNNFEKHLNGISESLNESERLNKLSNLVSHWSIAPPDPEISRQFNPQTCDISLSSSMDHCNSSQDSFFQMKQSFSDQYPNSNIRNSGHLSYCGHDLKTENEPRNFDAPLSFLRKSYNSNDLGYQAGFNSNTSSMVEEDNKFFYGMSASSHSQCSSARNFADTLTVSSRLTKPLINIHVPKPYYKSFNLSDSKKQGLRTSPTTKASGKERGTLNERNKKRIDQETLEAAVKKPKTENYTASSVKAPKVKITDKIAALQQIVSPFGKTDTASVLYEAIGYIKFLQEQVQLLSDPYMKSNSHKDPWRGLERINKVDMKVDLSSRGLCLVPLSCTPKVYHENAGSDYWTPAYRGCLYR